MILSLLVIDCSRFTLVLLNGLISTVENERQGIQLDLILLSQNLWCSVFFTSVFFLSENYAWYVAVWKVYSMNIVVSAGIIGWCVVI